MKIKILKSGSGLVAGDVKDIPNSFAMPLINSGLAEEVSSIKEKVEQKEVKVELETKENKFTSKRNTKNKK